MLILSARIENFGTIKDQVEVNFDDGLNVLHGPNECGKSTLMRAIWYALTRRAQSGAQDIAQIKPKTGGTPRVEVEVTIGEDRYRITKTFAGTSGTAHLRHILSTGDIREYADDEADERLRQALGFSRTTDRSKTPDHFGLWPLTWVRQGEDNEDPARGLKSRGHDEKLTEMLGQLTGQALAGSTAQGLFQALEEEYKQFYTSGGSFTSKSGAPLYEARMALEKAANHRDDLEQRQLNYEADLKRFARIQSGLQTLQEKELPEIKREYEEAEKASHQVERIQRRLETASVSRSGAKTTVEKWQELLERRQKLRTTIESLEEEWRDLQESKESSEEELERLQRERSGLVAAKDSGDGERKAARQKVQRLRNRLEVLRLQEQYDQREKLVSNAQEHHEALTKTRGELQAIDIDETAVDELAQLEREAEKSATALRAASARLELNALANVDLQFGGELITLEAGAQREELVDAVVTLRVDDRLEISIHPGDQDLVSLRDQAYQAEKAFASKLEELKIGSLSKARAQARHRRDLQADEGRILALLEQIAPLGLQKLQEELEALGARLADARKKVQALEEEEELAPGESEEGAQVALSDAESALVDAERRFEDARQALNEHDREVDTLRHDIELWEERQKAARLRVEEAEQELAATIRSEGEDDAVAEELKRAQEELAQCDATIATLQDELEKLSADTVEATLERAKRTLENIEVELQNKREEFAVLKSNLQKDDLHGLHEKLATANHEVELAENEVERWSRQAEATRLLYDTLTQSRQEIRQIYLQPLRESVAELLQKLFPESTIEFGDDFSITSISRRTEGGDSFDGLSFGSREQLGLVVRLAMARLLAREGKPLPVFLDDVLTSTDDERFSTMANILTIVARDLQLIVTTCHWERFRRLGATKIIDLEARKRGLDASVQPVSATASMAPQ